jgi:hypothetical protein
MTSGWDSTALRFRGVSQIYTIKATVMIGLALPGTRRTTATTDMGKGRTMAAFQQRLAARATGC